MVDPRVEKLTQTLIHYCCGLQPGETVLIEAFDLPADVVALMVRVVVEAGVRPITLLKNQLVTRQLLLGASAEQLKIIADSESATMSQVDAYIGIRGGRNVTELAGIPAEKLRLYESVVFKRVHLDVRLKRTRWVVLRWPTPSMAQLAGCSTEELEQFYFRVCNLDYARMSRASRPLKELMEQTDRVRILAPGTDLSFSIRGIPAVTCDGHTNLPDGEVFTAPVRESVNGTVRFNAPSLCRGITHENLVLRFVDGKIVAGESTQPAHLDAILDSDDGARYLGEFAIGFNPFITRPMRDILFDEKIAGSLHLTPGNAYEDAFNGNRSQIHWDLVQIQTPEWGGGEIWFDDRLIRKDGRFVLPDLEGLNPENLT